MKRWHPWIFGNFTLALVLALITWFGIREVTKHETVLTIDQVSVEPRPNWVVLEKGTDSFRVRFRGSKTDILRLHPSEVRLELNLAQLEASEQLTFDVRPRHVVAPGGVSVVSVEPSSVDLRLGRVEAANAITLTNEPVFALSDLPTEQLSIAPATATLVVKGKENSRTEENIGRVRIFVDCVGLAGDSSADLPVQVRLPAGLVLVSVSPETVNVQVSEKQAAPPPATNGVKRTGE